MPENNAYTRVIGITAIIITLLALKYPDCAVFDEPRRDIPHKKGWPLVGRLPFILKDRHRIHSHFLDCFNDLQTLTFTSSALGVPQSIVTIDPKNIEHILKDNFENYIKGPQLNDTLGEVLGHGIFNSNGERWKYQRKTASYIFNVRNFREHYTDVVVEELTVMFDQVINKAIQEKTVLDFQDLMLKYTLDSFMLIGFGTQLNILIQKKNVPFATAFDACQRNGFKRFTNPLWRTTEWLSGLVMPWRTSIAQHVATLHQFASDIVYQRRQYIDAGETGHTDLLSRFIKTRNERGDALSDQELRDMVLNFIIAGRDTTAQSLSWIFHELMMHPHVEEKLLIEINKEITDDLILKPTLLYDKIKGMVYAHAIFFEVLRLHPPVPTNQKFALNDDIWPDGTHIKKGDYVFWCSWAQGRSESIWGHDAKEFKPERWITPDGKLHRASQGQWTAFHAGPRVCLGQNLAILQTLITMIFLVKRYKLNLLPGQDITYGMSLTLPMKNGMHVLIDKR